MSPKSVCVCVIGMSALFILAGCDRVTKELSVNPDIVIMHQDYTVNTFSENVLEAKCRNVGAAGYVTFKYKERNSNVALDFPNVYFGRDEERMVYFTLKGSTISGGVKWNLSAVPQ